METNRLETSDIHEILRRHWGYDEFRPLQQDIIEHVLQGKDALALLPTGGGKSICFQVPALAMRGVCIVISPLIALMKDQVENLKKRGIPAEAVYTGLSQTQTELIFNAAVHQRIKFLYVSPERCRNRMFLAHLQRMEVCLLAVDEAHCVSQWGYDFRPPYLQIAELRAYLPKVPLLALTATATPDVVADIQEKLLINPRKVFQKSFVRENLTYYVIYDEDKTGRLERIIRKVGGSGIVYVRNRRKTVDIARTLQQRGIAASFYHGGLDNGQRSQAQQAWIENKTQVMVATNAFGMGIDKPDVRFVVHIDLPDTIEAYFQEAGRAGRDGKRAFALLIHHPSDKADALQNLNRSYPEMPFIRRVYDALGNHLCVPPGSGQGQTFPFETAAFARAYNLPLAETFSALSFLEKEGFFRISDQARESGKVHIITDYKTLYRHSVDYPALEPVIQALLRAYGGRLFSDFVSIDEKAMAARLRLPYEKVCSILSELNRMELIAYEPAPQGGTITLLMERREKAPVFLQPAVYAERKENATRKLDAMLGYAEGRNLCRNRYLLQYFGEHEGKDCGGCDVCLEKKRRPVPEKKLKQLFDSVRPSLQNREFDFKFLETLLADEEENTLKELWRYLLAEELITPQGALNFRLRG
ncbi:MAG: RecQ family ATP-dependent DNA helicase [Bacteroides sp.]|nr:RecQ family ATP-dependent DNA helicase [Bacteroides sp.]MCM1086009.1 RecQ family ATP-dependent DNA helicase [Bacteroides sp.]